METNNNNELGHELLYQMAVNSLYKGINDIIISLITIHDLNKDIEPLPIINFLHSLLASNTISIADLDKILDITQSNVYHFDKLITNIRQEMNI